MTPFKKILVPVDFSACSIDAVRAAADLAQRYDDAELTLVHVYEPILYTTPEGGSFMSPEQVESLLAEYTKSLERVKEEARAAGATRVDARELQGFAASEIVECARQGRFDLIVIGTHGRTGLKHALMGSVAERVVRTAPCPVLTVHETQAQPLSSKSLER